VLLLDEASGGSSTTTLLYLLFGSGGLVAALAGLFKLRGDRDTAAVAQAEKSNEMMDRLNGRLQESLDRASRRGDFWKAKYLEMLHERNELIRRWGPFPGFDVEDVVDEPETG
jgi:hypothetical protein